MTLLVAETPMAKLSCVQNVARVEEELVLPFKLRIVFGIIVR